jgi:Pyruvate/2-oxoacid:ferredoxin oxidoreductase delta subunit
MDPNGAYPHQQQDDHDVTPFHRISPTRVATGLSNGIRRTITFITEPLSPARSEWDLESAPSTPGLEKFRRWSTIRKSTDASALSVTRPVTPEEPRTFMTLPAEIHIVILQHLDFGDIERLRRTCKYWYNFATPRLVRSIWGPDTFRSILIRHCKICLTYCPRDVTRLLSTPLDAGYPLSSRCVKCTIQSRDGAVRIGRKTTLGNFTDYWTCRWCGWPITADQCSSHPQFHKSCYDRYAFVLLAFFLLGWVQFFLGVTGSGLCWHYFRGDTLVLAPTVVGFLLMWLCLILIMFRGNKVRTYNIALFLEVAIIGLWVSLECSYTIFPCKVSQSKIWRES